MPVGLERLAASPMETQRKLSIITLLVSPISRAFLKADGGAK